MPFLKIPEEDKAGFAKLLRLSDEAIEAVVSACREIRPKLFAENLTIELIPKVKVVPPEDIAGIIDSLWGLLVSGFHHDLLPDQIADDVVQALQSLDDNEIKSLINESNAERFKQRFIRLLTIETLVVGAKALGVLQENHNSFSSARILTDIRPVFGLNVSDAPRAAVILHMLNLTYNQSGEIKEFFVALDTTDVKALREVLDRADTKSESLKALIGRSGITYLDPQE